MPELSRVEQLDIKAHFLVPSLLAYQMGKVS